MTMTAHITEEMLVERGANIANELRAMGLPVMGVDAPDMFLMVGITFRLPNGRLCAFRLHYDDARVDQYKALLQAVWLD
jgi:hypothetical protein